MNMIVLSVLILILSVIIWDFISQDRRKVKLARQFKGPLALPLIGNFYMYLNKKPEGDTFFNFSLFRFFFLVSEALSQFISLLCRVIGQNH